MDSPIVQPAQTEDQLIRNIAKLVNSSGGKPINEEYIVAVIKAGRLEYHKQTPGDCGTQTPVGSATLTGTRYASAGLSAVGSLSEAGAFTMGATLGAVTAGVGLALLPIGLWAAHHAQAVAREQSVLCQLTVGFNSEIDAFRDAVAKKQLSEDQANDILGQLEQAAMGLLDQIYKDCNAACFYKRYVRGIIMYEKVKVQRFYAAQRSAQGAGPIAETALGKPLLAFGLLGAGALALG